MNVYRRGGKGWYFRFTYQRTRHRKGGFPTKRLAELAGAALHRQLATERAAREYGVTEKPRPLPILADFIRETFLPARLPRLAASSQRQYRSITVKLVEHLGAYRLDLLRGEVLDGYVSARLAETNPRLGRAPGALMVSNELRMLSNVINHARRSGLLTRHPMHGWRWPRVRPKPFRVVSEREERRLLAAAAPAFRPFIVLALVTGLRRDELRLLEATAVDWKRAELRVEQPKVHRTKVIPVEPATLRLLRQMKGGGRYVLTDARGAPRTTTWVTRLWTRARRRAGLRDVRFHDLRHTFATRLLDRGASIPVVGELLGHKPPYRMTMRYAHPLMESKRAAIRRLLSGPRNRPTAGRRRGKG